MTKRNLRRSVFIHLTVTAYHEGKTEPTLKKGSWRQELKQRPWRSIACWPALYGLLCPFSFTTQGHIPKSGPSHCELDHFTSIYNQKMPPQSCLQATYPDIHPSFFLSLSFFSFLFFLPSFLPFFLFSHRRYIGKGERRVRESGRDLFLGTILVEERDRVRKSKGEEERDQASL